MSVSVIFLVMADYSLSDLPYPIKAAVTITYMILTISWIMLMWFGGVLAERGIIHKLGIVFLMLLVLVFSFPLVILFSWLFSMLYFLAAYLLSGFSLLVRARKSLIDFVLFLLAMIPILVLQPIIRSITLDEFITPLTFIGSIAVFVGATEAARDFIYPMMGSRSRFAITSTAMLVALFGLSIFGQEIMGPSPLSLISGIISDYTFTAGVILGVLVLVHGFLKRAFGYGDVPDQGK